jgi:hypothetical protein
MFSQRWVIEETSSLEKVFNEDKSPKSLLSPAIKRDMGSGVIVKVSIIISSELFTFGPGI